MRNDSPTAGVRRPGQVPVPPTTLVGRRGVRASVRRALETSPFVTLTGPGGIGKSRLAVAVATDLAERFVDGVWFIDLTALPAELSIDEYALGIVTGRKHGGSHARAELAGFLRHRRSLVIFDNCETLVGESIRVITAILAAAPETRVLATSRAAFDSLRERVIDVPTLSLPDEGPSASLATAAQSEALHLLLDRVAPVRPDFRLDEENWRIVADVCRRLEGNPLAIELVAPRLRSLTLDRIIRSLDDRLSLTSNDLSVPERHKSIRDMIAWSWNTCTRDERIVWRRCAVFSGGFDLTSAETVCSSDELSVESVWQLIDSLVAKSLIVAASDGENIRFRQLETIAEFGREQLAATDETEIVARKHFDSFAALASNAMRAWPSGDQEGIVAMMRLERSNFASALGWGIATAETRAEACTLATNLRIHWSVDGFLGDGRRWLGRTLELMREPDANRCDALWVLGWIELLQGDFDAAEEHLDEAEHLANTIQGARNVSHIDALRGTATLWRGRAAQAAPVLERAHATALTSQDDVPGPRFVGMLTALACIELEDWDRLRSLEESHAEPTEFARDPWAVSQLEWAFAFAAFRSGRLEESRERFRRAYASSCAFDRVGAALKAETSSWLAASLGDDDRSAMLHGAATAIWSDLGTSIQAFGLTLAAQSRTNTEALRKRFDAQRLAALADAGAALDPDALARVAIGDDVRDVSLPSPADDDPLTPREREVARLMGDGLTNRQIATRLVLSARTVEGHISRILAKLQFESRAQITAWSVKRTHDEASTANASGHEGTT